MRVALVESGVLRPERFVYQCYPPHGLLYIAACVRQKFPETEIKIIDMMARRAAPADVMPALREFAPDLLAIHAMSFQSSCMHELAALIKDWRPECFVAAGGPHPSAAPEAVLADPNIDLAGIGEGERTFLDLMEALLGGSDPAGIPGTAVFRDGEPVYGEPREFIDDLDGLPFPAWDLVNLRDYFTDVMLNQNDITFRREVATIFTSRACPFGCVFCHNMFGKRFRARSPKNVLDEMETLVREHGITELHLIDDCFNCDAERAVAIMEGVVERGLDLKLAFPNGLRGDRLPDELLDAMVRAGVYKLNFGIESGSRRVQKLIKKGLSLDAIEDGVRRAAGGGIFCHGFFMLGFPGETGEEMDETIDFAKRTKLHTAGFALLSPFPGTEVAKMAVEMGLDPVFDPHDTSYTRVSSNLSAVDDQTLKAKHRAAHRAFYGSPGRILRIISAMPNKSDFLKVGMKHARLKFL